MEFPATLPEILARRRTALIVYDMQVGVLSQIDGAPVVAAVGRVLRSARAAGLPVFFTRHTSLPKALTGTFGRRQAMAWQRKGSFDEVQPWFLPGAPGVAIVPELAPTADEATFDKIAMSAFEGTPLTIAMRDLGLDSFLICGVATEIGIEPTVRHGTDLGFVPLIVEDACGHGHAEAAQRSLDGFRFTGDAILATVDEVERALTKEG